MRLTFHPGKPASARCALPASTLIGHMRREHPPPVSCDNVARTVTCKGTGLLGPVDWCKYPPLMGRAAAGQLW
jgi:hypothetical protein